MEENMATTYEALTTKKARIAYIKEQLRKDGRWAIRGLLTIYQQQTDEEKCAHATREHNGGI